ncbi:MAG: glycerophosphodiester phosphodiesterase family protein, partial [Dehalococcoidia bacterium]
RNSFDAMRECFGDGVYRFEIDVHSLAGPDFIIFHDRRLETVTNGHGSIGQATPDEVRAVRFNEHPDDRPPLLSEVVEMMRDCDTELQLDLKDWRPLPEERVRALVDTVAPVKERVIVSSGQDWNLARLRRANPEIRFGFDPGHYLDHAIEGDQVFLPRTMGAYGYRDDHPLAFGRTEATGDYLEHRMEMLLLQAPGAREYFLSYRLVCQMLDDGFNPAAWLHERGIDANVWTPDYHGEESARVLERLIAAGIDRVTTNTAPAWVEAFRRRGREATAAAS